MSKRRLLELAGGGFKVTMNSWSMAPWTQRLVMLMDIGLGVDGRRARARAGGVGGPSANAGNLQEREDRLEVLE